MNLALAVALLGCSRVPLQSLEPQEQRAIGEAAVAEVCDYRFDGESDITKRNRRMRDVAREYIVIVSSQVAEGELSRFLTTETLQACVADGEWGGVNSRIQRLVERYGTDEEKREQQRRNCELYPAYNRPDPTCEALGFSRRTY
jgi:hypothetical protein